MELKTGMSWDQTRSPEQYYTSVHALPPHHNIS